MKPKIDLERLKDELEALTIFKTKISLEVDSTNAERECVYSLVRHYPSLIELLEQSQAKIVDYRSLAQEMAADDLVSDLDAWLNRFKKEGEK